MKSVLLLSVRFYQKYLSFDRGLFKYIFPSSGTCRYQPTCSEFMYQAINRYGIIKGIGLGMKRILRCNPLASGGYDPIPS